MAAMSSPYLSYDEATQVYLARFRALRYAPSAPAEVTTRGASGVAAETLIASADEIADVSAAMIPLAGEYLSSPDPALREGISGQLLAQAAAESIGAGDRAVRGVVPERGDVPGVQLAGRRGGVHRQGAGTDRVGTTVDQRDMASGDDDHLPHQRCHLVGALWLVPGRQLAEALTLDSVGRGTGRCVMAAM